MKGDVTTIKDKKLLIIVCTDGQPTTSNGNDDQKALYQFLLNRQPLERIFITFACCTDDDQAIGYLEQWDKDIPHFDVVDDYYTERQQVIKAQGMDFSFSPGDYVVKMLLGSVDDEIDRWDESS